MALSILNSSDVCADHWNNTEAVPCSWWNETITVACWSRQQFKHCAQTVQTRCLVKFICRWIAVSLFRNVLRALTARKPLMQWSWKRWNCGEVLLPEGSSSWVISWLSLKAADSNPRLPPGEISRINPKSICTRCPKESTSILPLCRSFACKR